MSELLCSSLAVLAVACPSAAAQLPNGAEPVTLPAGDGAALDAVPGDSGQDAVDEAAGRPLPAPAEDVVESSPAAPVRDELRRVVKETAGTVGGGSGSGPGGSGTGSGAADRGGTGDGSGGGGSGTTDGGSRNGAARPNGAGGDERGRRRARRGATLRHDPRRSGAGAASKLPRNGSNAKDARHPADRGGVSAQSAAIRRIETLVRAVPTPIWIVLGILSALALALAGRTLVERRRARALARDREQLMGDVAVLERALLPAVPDRIGAVAASVAYRSSDGPAAGGDFYDAFELPDGRAAVIVGDVSGHGADALESTNSLRAQLHALLETGTSPRAAIATVSERSPVQLAGRFSTVVVAVHDPAGGTLTYATAGHAPPIVLAPAGEELLSVAASPPIGVGLRTGVRETTVALPSGSLCCLYTDGLVEAKVGEGMIGRAQLAAMVESLAPDEQADVLLQRVIDEADETCDDMTVCVLRPVSGAGALSARVELLELDPEDVENGFAGSFLEACGVPAGELAAAIEQARAAVTSNGLAVLEVTVTDGLGQARIATADTTAPPARV